MRYGILFLILSAALVASGCVAVYSDPQEENYEVGFENLNLIEDLAKKNGLMISDRDMPDASGEMTADSESSFIEIAAENKAAIYVLNMTKRDVLGGETAYVCKKYMAAPCKDGKAVVYEKTYYNPEWDRRHEELSLEDSWALYSQGEKYPETIHDQITTLP